MRTYGTPHVKTRPAKVKSLSCAISYKEYWILKSVLKKEGESIQGFIRKAVAHKIKDEILRRADEGYTDLPGNTEYHTYANDGAGNG